MSIIIRRLPHSKEQDVTTAIIIGGVLGLALALYVEAVHLPYGYETMRDTVLRTLLEAGTQRLHSNLIAKQSQGKVQVGQRLTSCLRRMEEEGLVGRFEASEPLRPERGMYPRYVYLLTNKGKEAARHLQA